MKQIYLLCNDDDSSKSDSKRVELLGTSNITLPSIAHVYCNVCGTRTVMASRLLQVFYVHFQLIFCVGSANSFFKI